MSDSNSGTKAKGFIDKELLDACIHCGICLPACPTYLATGREMESPRGRIYLLSQWNEGQLPLESRLAEHIDSCLGCYGCETACPSGVQYEYILEQSRPHIATMRPGYQRWLMRLGFKSLLPNYKRLHVLAKLMKLWQKFAGSNLLRILAGVESDHSIADRQYQPVNPLRKLFYRFWQCDALLPPIPQFKPLPAKSWKSGEKTGTVQLFGGCVMDVFYNDVNHAAIDLLKAQGLVVEVPAQTCCGALAAHAGESDIMRDLAKENIAYFERNNVGSVSIVVTSAGCGAMLKQYKHTFAQDADWAERARTFSERVVDITEELAKHEFQGTDNIGSLPCRKVAYHAACHLAHAQNVREAPQKLLADLAVHLNARAGSANKIELIPLREAEHCCGSAGIYNLLHTELSMDVLARKMDFIEQTGADTVVTTNPGCLLQLKAGVKERKLPIAVLHLCEILRDAYCSE